MKKIIALLSALLLALSLTACSASKSEKADKKDETGESMTFTLEDSDKNGKDDKKDSAKDSGKPTALVDHSKALKELNGKKKKLVDTFGESERDKKIVAFFGSELETQFVVVEFKDGKVSDAKNYRFLNKENAFNGYKKMSSSQRMSIVIHEDEKCVELSEKRKYSGKTYDEMVALLSRYDFK